MTKSYNFSKRKRTISRKFKNTGTGGDNYVKVEERDKKKAPPSTTAAAAATSTAAVTAATTTFSSPSPTLPTRPPQREAAARATEQIQCLTENDEPGSGTIGDPNEAFINGVCKDPRLKTIDKDKLARMAIIHIYVCVLDSPPKRDENGNKQWGGQGKCFSQIRKAMPGWEAEEKEILRIAETKGENIDQVRRIHCDKKHKTISKVIKCYNNCIELGIDFDGEWKYFRGRRRDYKIGLESKEAAMIANALEAGNSIEMTVEILNDYREEHQL